VADLVTHLPVYIWFEENPYSDTSLETDLLGCLPTKPSLIPRRPRLLSLPVLDTTPSTSLFHPSLESRRHDRTGFHRTPSSKRDYLIVRRQCKKCTPAAAVFGTGSLWFYLAEALFLRARPYQGYLPFVAALISLSQVAYLKKPSPRQNVCWD